MEKVFKLNITSLIAETKKEALPTLEAGFEKEAGGDLFTCKLGPTKFRYEYAGEWIEFEPQGHAPTLSATLGNEYTNEYTLENYWTDTDLRFTVRDYGVKVDIILNSAKAPTEFAFRVAKSEGWKDEWIRRAFVYSPDSLIAFYMIETWEQDTVTYSLPEEASALSYPLIIDPTFDLGNSVDDTEARRRSDEANNGQNYYGATTTMFGHFQVSSIDYDSWNYTRFSLNQASGAIPRASRITAANLSFKAAATNAQTFNTTIYGLQDDGSWRGVGGFHIDNYADAAALNAISHMSTSVAWNNVAAWTLDSWHDSPDILAILQNMIDTLNGTNEYDPLDSSKKYVAFKVDEGDGIWTGVLADWRRRAPYSYDDALADGAELDVTFDPWGVIRSANGMKYDTSLGVYRYFDY